jgi:hypothetical protein
MMGKRLFVVLAAVALLGLQFADCMSAMTQDQQSMQCCGSMPCDPSNQSHDCCKSMVSSQSPSVLPVAHVTLHPPSCSWPISCLPHKSKSSLVHLVPILKLRSIRLPNCTRFILPS